MADKLVTAARFVWLDDAEEAASVLRGYGIESSISSRNLLSWYPQLSVALRGANLQVRNSRLADAMEILRETVWQKIVRCPVCDSASEVGGRRCGWLVFAVFTLGGVPVRPLPRRWRYRDCGCRWKSRHERQDDSVSKAGADRIREP